MNDSDYNSTLELAARMDNAQFKALVIQLIFWGFDRGMFADEDPSQFMRRMEKLWIDGEVKS